MFDKSETITNLHNHPEYSVSEISSMLKRTVEENFSYVRVRGEISGLKVAPSGHIYFSIKDSGASIAAICWKGTASKLSIKLEEGLEIVCIGSVTTYAMQSKYQMIVESFEVAGAGALMALLQKRKEQLAKEGLFEQSRKKPLPKFPQTIGIVTSPTGAVIRDILHRLEERMPCHVLVWPVLVQGAQAAEQIASAIHGFNQLGEESSIKRPDLLIVARGGGSIEDLWAFNEEIVARAAAASNIPLISAVGHETDTTLIDYVSDVRCPTPTAAAEIALPLRSQLLTTLDSHSYRLKQILTELLNRQKSLFLALSKGLPNPKSLLVSSNMRLDDLSSRLGLALPRLTSVKGHQLASITSKLRPPVNLLMKYQHAIAHSSLLLNRLYDAFIEKYQHRLELVSQNLLLCSYHKTLERGFAIVRDQDNNIISGVADIKSGAEYDIELRDGKTQVVAK